jgi:hypothetical protein
VSSFLTPIRGTVLLILGISLVLPGCGSLGGLSSPLGAKSKEAALRKKVEADPFPSAGEPTGARPAGAKRS